MRWSALIATVLLAGVLAAPAHGQAVSPATLQIVRAVQGGGQVDPCKYTTAELQKALEEVQSRSDLRQYAGDISASIRAAINARARGDCDTDGGSGSGTPAATPTPPPAATPTPPPTPDSTPVPTETVIPEPPGPDAQLAAVAPVTPPVDGGPIGRPGNEAPTPLLLLGVLALVGLIGFGVARGGARVGVSEGPLAPVRHAWREAAWRFGGNWESFRDWVRLGR